MEQITTDIQQCTENLAVFPTVGLTKGYELVDLVQENGRTKRSGY